MKTFFICIKHLDEEIELKYVAKNKEDVERMVREDYSIDFRCKPEDVNILWIDEI